MRKNTGFYNVTAWLYISCAMAAGCGEGSSVSDASVVDATRGTDTTEVFKDPRDLSTPPDTSIKDRGSADKASSPPDIKPPPPPPPPPPSITVPFDCGEILQCSQWCVENKCPAWDANCHMGCFEGCKASGCQSGQGKWVTFLVCFALDCAELCGAGFDVPCVNCMQQSCGDELANCQANSC